MSALKREVGDEIAVTTRFETDTVNGDHKIDHHDEGTRFVEIMHREGVVDLWALKIGDYEEWGEDAGSSRFRETNWMRPFVKDVKGLVGDIPVVSNGRHSPIPTSWSMPSMQASATSSAPPGPRYRTPSCRRRSRKAASTTSASASACNMCVSGMQQQALLWCTQNATIGEEYRRGWHPETFPRGPRKRNPY